MKSNFSLKPQLRQRKEAGLLIKREAYMLTKILEDTFRRAWESNLYKDHFYFVSQIFEEDWLPRDSIIDYDDETINGMPLADSREHE
jgi:hypothetical protein